MNPFVAILIGLVVGVILGFYLGSKWSKPTTELNVRNIKNKARRGGNVTATYDVEVNKGEKETKPEGEKKGLLRGKLRDRLKRNKG